MWKQGFPRNMCKWANRGLKRSRKNGYWHTSVVWHGRRMSKTKDAFLTAGVLLAKWCRSQQYRSWPSLTGCMSSTRTHQMYEFTFFWCGGTTSPLKSLILINVKRGSVLSMQYVWSTIQAAFPPICGVLPLVQALEGQELLTAPHSPAMVGGEVRLWSFYRSMKGWSKYRQAY